MQAAGHGWSTSVGRDTVTTSVSTSAATSVPQATSVQLYSDMHVAGVSPASDLQTNAVYRSSVVYQQVTWWLIIIPICD